ncbi:MAG: DUF3179 domain-containing protein [Deltaproteobacteria bacterium]|nr:DUF3179 domain-containing protein [Deltaproteobacteria bacterium]
MDEAEATTSHTHATGKAGATGDLGLSPGLSRDFALPLNNPGLVDAAHATFMKPTDLVVGVVVAGQARAYPWWVLSNYHVVNDTVELPVGGKAEMSQPGYKYPHAPQSYGARYVPLLITYCELCNGGAAFIPEVDKRSLVFMMTESHFSQTGGNFDAFAIYTICDLETQSRWHPMSGLAMSGPLKGTQLTRIPAFHDHWEDWVKKHPDTKVVEGAEELRHRAHLHGRDYAKWDPVKGEAPPFPGLYETLGEHPELINNQLPVDTLVLGVTTTDHKKSMVYTVERLRELGGLVQHDLNGEPYVLILSGPISATAYSRKLPGSPSVVLNFKVQSQSPFVMVDDSGTTWNEFGEALSGKYAGKRLQIGDAYVAKWSEYPIGKGKIEILRN